MSPENHDLNAVLERTAHRIDDAIEQHHAQLDIGEIGRVRSIGHGVATVLGLPGVQAEELVRFRGGLLGLAFNLDHKELGVVLLGKQGRIAAGSPVYRTGRVYDVPVGEQLIGRMIDATGKALDGQGSIGSQERMPVERQAPMIMERKPVSIPLQTGLIVIDALLPLGRGQRELILGDRQTGKTAIAIDAIINQRGRDVLCIYCAIGQRETSIARVRDDLTEHDAMSYTIIVVASDSATPGLRFLAPYSATSIAEYFREQGRDVLIVYDDLTRHARAYRELSLLLRRPPGREAYPGDIFYIHSRLLERSAQLSDRLGGGSITALPIVETQEENISAYIPTNLISITDGQIYCSRETFEKGMLPAVDVGESVSRVGGQAQLDVYQRLVGRLRLSYAQLEDLEDLVRFGTRLDEETQQRLERGRRIRQALQQRQFQPMPVVEQIAVLIAVTEGMLDTVPVEELERYLAQIRKSVREQQGHLINRVRQGHEMNQEEYQELRQVVEASISIEEQ